MATYTVTDPTTGKTVTLTGDSPPTSSELENIFSTISEKQKQTTPQENVFSKVSKSLLTAPIDLAKSFSTPENIIKNYGSEIPIAGGIVGGTLMPGAGAPVGAMVGQMLRNVGQIAYDDPNAPKTPVDVGANVALQGLAAGAPEVEGIKTAANVLGRRALGFTKPMLKRLNFGVPQANEVANEMLDKGVIKFGSSAASNLERANEVAQESGQTIGNTLSSTGEKVVNPSEINSTVKEQISPKYKGGAYDKTKKIVDEIEKTINAHGPGEIDFKSAQDLKEKLGSIANFMKKVAPEKGVLYRRAYGIVSDAIDKGIETVAEKGAIPTESLPAYLSAKKTYAASRRAIEALTDKAAADASNSILSLRGSAIAAGSLASGNVPAALAELGGWEAARRIGAGSGAAALNTLARSPVARVAVKVPLQEMIGRLIKKYDERRQF